MRVAGEIVVILDVNVAGVIESVEKYADGMIVYGIRCITGTLYAREEIDIETPADTEIVETTKQDMRILAPHHPELRKAAGLLDGALSNMEVQADRNISCVVCGERFATIADSMGHPHFQ